MHSAFPPGRIIPGRYVFDRNGRIGTLWKKRENRFEGGVSGNQRGGEMATIVDWRGKSGSIYRYHEIERATPDGVQAVAGNYVFAKQLLNGNFIPLYFGQAGDLQAHIPAHELMPDANRLGATHVMAHSTEGGVQVRCAEEQDLIEYWNPPLNVQYRKVS